jgi:branched-chain amino acid aminotransferase
MPPPLALLNGQLLPAGEVAVPVDDAGFMLGVTVPEQLRTFAGKVFRLEQHLDRLFRGLNVVGVTISYSREQLADFALELVAHNYALLPPGDDLGLTMFVTPGPYSPMPGRGPLVCMHTRPLAHGSFAELYERGQDLVTTPVHQVPADCWPVELKCRSRMHYWLADREARRIDPNARALMLDHEDYVTESSTANLLLYRQAEGLVSPPKESILPGISVATLADLAQSLGIPFLHRKLRVEDVIAADEVLLCSTSPCTWPVLRVNGHTIGSGAPGETFHRLIAAWSAHVGIDIVAQAKRPS